MTRKKRFFTITEAAKKLGVKRQAIHEAIKKGRLEAKRGKITHTRIVKTTVIGWKIDAKSLDGYRVSNAHQQAGRKKL
jgi:excisionase family DNA binding protein